MEAKENHITLEQKVDKLSLERDNMIRKAREQEEGSKSRLATIKVPPKTSRESNSSSEQVPKRKRVTFGSRRSS